MGLLQAAIHLSLLLSACTADAQEFAAAVFDVTVGRDDPEYLARTLGTTKFSALDSSTCDKVVLKLSLFLQQKTISPDGEPPWPFWRIFVVAKQPMRGSARRADVRMNELFDTEYQNGIIIEGIPVASYRFMVAWPGIEEKVLYLAGPAKENRFLYWQGRQANFMQTSPVFSTSAYGSLSSSAAWEKTAAPGFHIVSKSRRLAGFGLPKPLALARQYYRIFRRMRRIISWTGTALELARRFSSRYEPSLAHDGKRSPVLLRVEDSAWRAASAQHAFSKRVNVSIGADKGAAALTGIPPHIRQGDSTEQVLASLDGAGRHPQLSVYYHMTTSLADQLTRVGSMIGYKAQIWRTVGNGMGPFPVEPWIAMQGPTNLLGYFAYVAVKELAEENYERYGHLLRSLSVRSLRVQVHQFAHTSVARALAHISLDEPAASSAQLAVVKRVQAAVDAMVAGRKRAEAMVRRAFSEAEAPRLARAGAKEEQIRSMLRRHMEARARLCTIVPASSLEQGIVEHSVHAAFLASRRVIIALKSHLHDGRPEQPRLFREIADQYPAGSVNVVMRPFNHTEWRDTWVTDRFAAPNMQWIAYTRYAATQEALQRNSSLPVRQPVAVDHIGAQRASDDDAAVHAAAARFLSAQSEKQAGGPSGLWQLQIDADEVVDPWRLGRVLNRLHEEGAGGGSLLAVNRVAAAPAPAAAASATATDGGATATGSDVAPSRYPADPVEDAWIAGLGCSLASQCPSTVLRSASGAASMPSWVRRSETVPLAEQITVEYGLLLREDVIRRLSPSAILHHLDRNWASSMDTPHFWPRQLEMPRRFVVDQEPEWSSCSAKGLGACTTRPVGGPVVLHLRDVRLSDDLLALKYTLRGESGYTAPGYEKWQIEDA